MTRLAGSFFTHDAEDAPFWRKGACPEPETDELPHRTEIAIVGGGVTGLSAALTLAGAGREVTVVEAEPLGRGASSRGAGMLAPGWEVFDTDLRNGTERARAMLADSRAAIDHVKALVAREAIECDLAVAGYFRGAATPGIYDAMGRNLDRLARAMPVDAYMVLRADQRTEIGTDLYHGGIAVPGCAGLDPARFVTGLAAAARRAGARIVAGARVSDVQAVDGGFAVEVPRGAIRAAQVLVAASGFTGEFEPELRRRSLPVRSAMIATEPLPQAVMTRLMPKRRMLAGSQRVATYLRPSPGGRRILFGGQVFKPGDGNAARTNAFGLRRRLLRVFPDLEQNLVSHYWEEDTAITPGGQLHLNQANGLFFAGHRGGADVARATWLGHLAARRMLGKPVERSAREDAPRPRHSYRDAPWLMSASRVLDELMDRWDGRRR